MNFRLSSLRAVFGRPRTGRLAAAAALAWMLTSVGLGGAWAAPAEAASAPDGAAASAPSASYASGGQYTVKPGQSLNDVAIAVTQSHDRATLARAARALFDANPNAFMGHDPSRMRLGAQLTVPPLDASGAVAASAGASAPAAVSGSSANASVAAPASGAAQGNAAASATGAETSATQAAAPAAPAPQATASAATDAGSAVSGGAVSSVPAAGSQAASAASGTHVWAGSVQPSASEAAATGASQPRTQVSSLQQLLALKNRVLMELQKHGIGGAPAARVAPSASGVQPAAGASAAAVVPGHAGAALSTSNGTGLSQTNLAVGAAIGAALVVLLTALRLGRRKRERLAKAQEAAASANAAAGGEVAPASENAAAGREVGPASVSAAAGEEVGPPSAGGEVGPAAFVAARGDTANRDEREADLSAAAVQQAATAAAAEREAAEGDAAAREMSERLVAEREAEIRTATARENEAHQAAEQGAVEREAAEGAAPLEPSSEHAAQEPSHEAADGFAAGHPAELEEPLRAFAVSDTEPAAEPHAPEHPTAFEQNDAAPEELRDNLHNATTTASLEAAAELGADALPRAPLEPLNDAWEPEPLSHRLEWDDEPLPPEPMEPTIPQGPATTAPVADDGFGATAHEESRPAASTEFPRDAVDAFGSLDMPLPPRLGATAGDTVGAPQSLSSQPVASPEATARRAVPPPPGADEAPHAADEIAAGTAGRGAVAGLGAGSLGTAGFGALKLDFDLELPPGPTEPLPVFTPADLARIARNKLDLAAEYIELGDLAGARTLINEVIEANDPATRNDARALLSTLAPLS
ncbi:FimV/HubP family polar landmark protein [Paraburkholderia phenoliruptrix]|uniref:FimV/HubP family polar landmark protein n=1 Tax=Paraburkholderia phenoliruptrix TaxID=252970 RepID=UPI0028699BC6|nr:FimV/HubP family polar landmark protein [Paraburkholderia phenoliruptrix]WMY11199.1 FimV/HubP family polar landmark protein [Paraburkholderia phenoliruptrix]